MSRDFNSELQNNGERAYFYSFDSDFMHGFMIRTFMPFFSTGSCLELGSHKGQFTIRLADIFSDVTCIEASDEAAVESERTFRERGLNVNVVNSVFENTALPRKFDNIFLTHVLEHIDQPVELLQKIKDEWLSETGKLFVACPNANAASRQIAVNMGLIDHNQAVTDGERLHGHRRTYSLDTLRADIAQSGLGIVKSGGICFKPLANYQFDKALSLGVIDEEYIDACYHLGDRYPDLCASVYCICSRTPRSSAL